MAYTTTDLAGMLERVYPGVRHLLCKWHVDRYIITHYQVTTNHLEHNKIII